MSAETRCLHCGRVFRPSKAGHVYCSPWCRHRGPRPEAAGPADEEQLERLFDESRDPKEQARAEDWHPDSSWAALDANDTLGARRRWYLALLDEQPSWSHW
jgi:hypothetical protein